MRTLLLISCLLTLQSQASTFVGNGGHAGDVEKQVTVKEIQDTLRLIQVNKNDPEMKLCVCYPKLEGHPICETLKKLSPAQVTFCANYLVEHSQEFKSSLSESHIRWTNNEINVQEEQKLRAADAVTDFDHHQITLNQNRFLEMKEYERIFLLTHELGHLQKYQDKPIQDNQALGPFTGPEGGRDFLNSLAAAMVMESLDTGVLYKYDSALHRSQLHKDIWIDLGLSSSQSEKDNLRVSQTKGALIGARYQFFENWGASLDFRSSEGKESYLSTTRVTEKISALSAKLNYRLAPFQDPLSFWGQSHFIAGVGVEALHGEYSIADSFIETSDQKSSTALIVDLSYYLPLSSGFWLFARIGYAGHHYQYEIPFATIDMKPSTLTNLGVSYGF